MLYILDSNAFSDLMREHPKVVERLEALTSSDRVAICSIVRGEIAYGIARLPAGKKRSALESKALHLFAVFETLPVPAEAGDVYARVKIEREQAGLTLDENDLWIATTTITSGATLVSRDTDFGGIDGLQVEDWTRT